MNFNRVIVTIMFCFLMSCSSDKDKNEKSIVVKVPEDVIAKALPIIDFTDNLDRIMTFARIATSVQFYYPGQGSYDTDWDAFISYGMYEVALTNTEQEFVETMRTLFIDIAPGVAFNENNYQAPTFKNEDIIIVWHQNGYRDRLDKELNVYTSVRSIITYGQLLADATYTKQTSYHIDYGNIIFDMPLVLATELSTSLPQGKSFSAPQEWLIPTSIENPYGCLSSFSKVWAGINNYWPYFDAVDVDWLQELRVLMQVCAEPERRLSMMTLSASLTKLQDNHINFGSNSNAFTEQFTIPVGFDWVEGMAIAVVKEDSAPDDIDVGDQLLTIDGQDVISVVEEFALYTQRSKLKRNHWSLLRYVLRREESTVVVLTLEKPSGQQYAITLTANSDLYDVLISALDAYVPPATAQHKVLENDIHYVDLSISEEEHTEATISALTTASAIVFDFRNYPESWFGWLNILAHLSANPISSAPMYMHWTGAPDRYAVFKAHSPQSIMPRAPQIDVPVVVLASRYSQSSNEHALAYLQNAGVPIMGEATSGINGNITFLFTGGGASNGGIGMIFTGMEVRQNDGSAHIGVGIVPDIYVEQTREAIINGEDHQLNQAIKYLKAQLVVE